MTKASDNAFPSLLITEGTEPSAPAAGKQRLYIDSTTHKLKRTDSGGVDVDIESAGGGISTDSLWDAAGDLAVGTGANTAAKLTKGSALDVLRVNAGGTDIEWAAPSAASLTSTSAHITSPVTMTNANQFYDWGITYTPATGTWLVTAVVQGKAGGGACTQTAKLWDGTTSADASEITLGGASYNTRHHLQAIVTGDGAKVFKVSVASNATGSTIVETPANNGTGLTNLASGWTWLKIA